ncbi:hypothetical protein [Microbulbifer litoralis]|uniref:O-linked N-acetylglucosamine transferase, SPINDLY family protein n=1 Tax=Microbulbifer litoralis TaxID=2933965 RepID=UPI0020284B1F|nr:hypothetical protein [Microbulbifer sp. GX H0434]
MSANNSAKDFTKLWNRFTAARKKRDGKAAGKIAGELARAFPRHAAAWRAQAMVALDDGNSEAALRAAERALQQDESDSEALYLKGLAQLGDRQWQAAADSLARCLRLAPEHALAHTQLARAFQSGNRLQQALESITRARELAPDNSIVLMHSIHIHSAARRMETVLRDSRRLLELEPGNASFHNLAAVRHFEMGHFADGAGYLEKALELKPDYLEALSNRVFNAHYDPALGAADIRRLIARWRAAFSPRERPPRPETHRDPHGRITLGLVSPGLRAHPVGQMITAALEQLPAGQFQLVAYSNSDREDPLSDRIRRLCHRWHRVAGDSDSALEALIREDGVDILIDMSGHTEGNRLRLLSREPAPLIVKWVGGLVNTNGLDAIDYLISDSVETPPGCDGDYYEKLIRLPDDYICYLPPEQAPPVGELPALANGGIITFGCLNNPVKVNPQVIRQWARLLLEQSNSRLLLKGGQYNDADYCESLWYRFEQEGIERSRVLLEGPDSHSAFLATYNRIDIALDPWPYSGGLTTCEALLMGVPVITLPGPTFAGRHAATHLVNAGLPELVVNNWDAYRSRASELAADLNSLATIRRHLREILKQSPVCDAPRFGRHLATALRAVWQRHCEGLPPAALTFEKNGAARFEGSPATIDSQPFAGPALAQACRSEESGFQFRFSGKVVTLDNGARLLEEKLHEPLGQLGTFELLVFDPASRHQDAGQQARDECQYFPGTGLGDGRPATLHACLDPEASALLQPVAADAQVLAKLPLPTVALDSIEGLPGLDWLLLDQRGDLPAILDAGQQTLATTLLLQVRLAIAPLYREQPDIGDISGRARALGFQLYRIDRAEYCTRLPENTGGQTQASQLRAIDLVFIPDEQRLDSLGADRREKLAFLLHSVFGFRDLACDLLGRDSLQRATDYLREAERGGPPLWPTGTRAPRAAAADNTVSDEIDRLLGITAAPQ